MNYEVKSHIISHFNEVTNELLPLLVMILLFRIIDIRKIIGAIVAVF